MGATHTDPRARTCMHTYVCVYVCVYERVHSLVSEQVCDYGLLVTPSRLWLGE